MDDWIKLPKLNLYFGAKRKRTLSLREKQIVYKRAGGRCEACGKKITFSEMQVGHRKAYSKGGATSLANSVCLCYECNKLQGTDDFETFKKKLEGTYGRKKSKEKRSKKKKSGLLHDFEIPKLDLPRF